VFFYAIGGGWGNISGLGVDRMDSYARLFGLGDLLGIDLPWEADGNIPTEEWKFKTFGENWYIGDSYHDVIGQGFITTTPLQMANATAVIANGGRLFRPQVVNKIKKPNGEEEILDSQIIREDFFSRKSIEITREGMRETVAGDSGSGRSLNELEVKSAGKTGTAQFGTEDKTHSWYTSFAPYNNPEIVMAVLVEGGGDGHSFAVPATKDIYRWYFEERE
jgi:penicillin-binding protein 2